MAQSLLRRRPLPTIAFESADNQDPIDSSILMQGFILSSLIEETEALHTSNRVADRHLEDLLEQLLTRCKDLANTMEELRDQFLEQSPSPPYWPDPNTTTTTTTTSTTNSVHLSQSPPKLLFPGLALATRMSNFWALQLVLSFVVFSLRQQIPSSPSPTLAALTTQLSCTFSPSICLSIALKISSAVHYCIQPEMGTAGCLGSLLPLTCAYWYSKMSGSEHLTQTKELQRILVEEKGVLFARDLDGTVGRDEEGARIGAAIGMGVPEFIRNMEIPTPAPVNQTP